MKNILYLLDNDYNMQTKIVFEKESMLEEYIAKHQAEESESNIMVLTFDSNDDIVSLKIYKDGDLVYIKFVPEIEND